MRQNTQKEQKQDTEEVLCQISARITSYWSLAQYNDGHKPPISLKKSLSRSKEMTDMQSPPPKHSQKFKSINILVTKFSLNF